MPSVTIPLVGPHNQRGGGDKYVKGIATSRDQRFINVFFDVATNKFTNSGNLFIQKRPAPVALATLTATGNVMMGGIVADSLFRTGFYASTSGTSAYILSFDSVSGGTATLLDTITGTAFGAFGAVFSETYVSGITYIAVVINDNGTTSGYYYASNMLASFTGNRTSGSPIVSGIATTVGLHVGQGVSGTGFAAGTRILSVDSATQVTLTNNASSGAATSTSFTAALLAKILDADFPTNAVGGIVFMDGLAFVMDANGVIHHSDINTLNTWPSSAIISCNVYPDKGSSLIRANDTLIGFSRTSIEFFRNAGNPSGSVLSRIDERTINIGCAAHRHIWKSGDDIYFYGTIEQGNRAASATTVDSGRHGLYVISGGQIRKISTPIIDAICNPLFMNSIGGLYLFGRNYILMNAAIGSGGTAFVYDVSLGDFVGEWSTGADTYYNTFKNCIGSNLFLSDNSGVTDSRVIGFAISSSGAETYQDDGATDVAITATVQTSKTDFGTDNRKYNVKVALFGADIQASGTATLEYSDDDYANWTTAGTFDLTTSTPRINRVKDFVGGRAWRLTHSANTAFRAQSLKFDFDIGAH